MADDQSVRVYRFAGDFDVHNIWDVQAEIEKILEEGCTHLVLNVRRISLINSSALGYLVKTRVRLRELGGDLCFSEPSPFFTRTMSILGLDRIFQIHPNDEAAVSAFEVNS